MALSKSAWKPGYCPNPKGRPVNSGLPPDVTDLKNTAKVEAIRAISECLLMTREEIRERTENPNSSMVELLTCTVIAKALKEGDIYRMSLLLNYIMGKPKPLDHSWHDDSPDETNSAEARQSALKKIPSAALLEIVRRTNAGSGGGSEEV